MTDIMDDKKEKFAMILSKEQVEWVINRKKILDHIYYNRDKRWMPYIFPDNYYRESPSASEKVWEEIKKQIEAE